jgi:hypothetical protein
MNKLKLSLLAAFMLAAGFMTVNAQTADEIMEKYVAAIGGPANWDKVKTIKMVGSMSQQGMEITLTQTIAIGKAMRTDISVMGMSGWQIVTTTGGWMYMPFMGSAKIDTMKPEMVKISQKQMDLKSRQMLDYKTNGTKMEYAGRDTTNNAACFKVKVTDKDGNESASYFDCSTYYLVRTETKVKQDEQEQEVAVVYNNYKKFDEGITLPMSVNARGGEIVFKTVEINKPIDESVFLPKVEASKEPAKESNTAPASAPTKK